MSMFIGQFETKFTSKGRVILPKILRQEAREEIILTIESNYISGYLREDFLEEIEQRVSTLTTEERVEISRLLYSQSYPVELDNQGRFIIPTILLEQASLTGDLVIIGVGNHFEIWDRQQWSNKLGKIKGSYG